MITLLVLALIQAPVNLAKGKAATASSTEAGKDHGAARAVDGDAGTRWCAANGTFPQWWAVDLGEARHVRGVRLAWEGAAPGYRYGLEGSADGQAWKSLADVSKGGSDGAHKVDAPGTRHLRVTCSGSAGGWASLVEVEVYESSPPAPKLADPLKGVKAPAAFDVTLFGEPPDVNYPVCLAATPSGELFVGVDENGSLGKVEGYGKVLRCADRDGDGRAEEIKVFAKLRHPRGLVRQAMMELANGAWMTAGRNVLITGPTGVGKSYIACALGNLAARAGHPVLYARAPRLFESLHQARGDGSHLKALTRMGKVQVLIIDDFLITPLAAAERKDFLEIMAHGTELWATVQG